MRITLRISLDRDTKSRVRNAVKGKLTAPSLGAGRFKNQGTATWKATAATAQSFRAARDALAILAAPTKVSGADPNVSVDHIWFYLEVDK